MRRNPWPNPWPNPWLRAGFDLWSLGVESAAVVTLRTLKIAAGGKAGEAEARRMVDEKLGAGVDLQTLALSGGLGFTADGATRKTIALYRRKVRANRRRLGKKP